MAEEKKSNIWYVTFPTHQYVQDVKTIARQKGLKIVDARFQGENKQCEGAPSLTLIKAKKAD